MAQIFVGAPWCVSHSYNMVLIGERQAEIAPVYATHAPRSPGDDALDVAFFVERMGKDQGQARPEKPSSAPGSGHQPNCDWQSKGGRFVPRLCENAIAEADLSPQSCAGWFLL